MNIGKPIVIAVIAVMVVAGVVNRAAAQDQRGTDLERQLDSLRLELEQQRQLTRQQEERATALEAELRERSRPNQRQVASQTPLQVQVVVSRYQNDRRISSVPYALAVNAPVWPEGVVFGPGSGYGEAARLRMGARVPVPSLQPTSPDGQVFSPVSPVTYEDIGTNIDCRARALGDGSFELSISLEDKSVYANDDLTTKPIGQSPVFRTFQSSNALILRDGQSQQFTAATDRVNGETVRVEVTLTVVK